VIVRSGDGDDDGCCCGGDCPCCGEAQKQGAKAGKSESRRSITLWGGGEGPNTLSGGKTMVLGPEGAHTFTLGGQGAKAGKAPKAKVFRIEGGEDDHGPAPKARTKVFRIEGDDDDDAAAPKAKAKVKAKAFGHGIVIGPDGQKREFEFGHGDGEQPHVFQFGGGDGDEAHVFRVEPGEGPHALMGEGGQVFKFQAPEGGQHKIQLRKFHEGQGAGPGGSVRGHIVIVGPDGKEQVFNFGGGDDELKVKRLAPMELRDGDGPGMHLWRMQEDDGPQDRTVIRRRTSGGVL
jgi:hypothetical protein